MKDEGGRLKKMALRGLLTNIFPRSGRLLPPSAFIAHP
jgi:hypothetical protein